MWKKKKVDIHQERPLFDRKIRIRKRNRLCTTKFQSSHGAIGESTVRLFKKKYEAVIKDEARKKVSPKKAIAARKRGRSVLLFKIDEIVQRFLLVVRKKGGVVNAVVARSVAKALVKRSGKKELKVIDLDSRCSNDF